MWNEIKKKALGGWAALADNIDFDASAILASGARVADLGDGLYDYAIEVASGTRTTSEVLDVRETAISRFERSL